MKKTFWITTFAASLITLLLMTNLSSARTLAVSVPAISAAIEDSPAAAVKIDNFTFSPNLLTIEKGTTVRWTNHDDVPHTVVADDKSFKSKALDTDEAFAYTFTKPGTYSYFCSLHPKMVAKVVVK
jgi:plastocyanin